MGFLSRSKTPKTVSSPQPPPYDSINPPASTDEKKPLSPLAILRNQITTNRAEKPNRDARLQRAFVDHMAQVTHGFLSDYSFSVHPEARLAFIPSALMEDDYKYEAVASAKVFGRTEYIDTAMIWNHFGVAKATAKDLQAKLEEKLGNFDQSKRETNVEFTVAAKFRTLSSKDKNTIPGWIILVKVRIGDAK